jgi:cbb3-type cytochrome oxidase subunit 3
MPFLFALIFLCWFLTWFFLFRRKPKGILDDLREAEQAMKNASTSEDRVAAAKRVLDIIEEDELTGVVVDDARAEAEKVLRFR